MNIKGTVSISIKDFEMLRRKEEVYDRLVNKLQGSVTAGAVEIEKDNWIGQFEIDAYKLAEIAVECSGVNGLYETDKIIFTNMESIMIAE